MQSEASSLVHLGSSCATDFAITNFTCLDFSFNQFIREQVACLTFDGSSYCEFKAQNCLNTEIKIKLNGFRKCYCNKWLVLLVVAMNFVGLLLVNDCLHVAIKQMVVSINLSSSALTVAIILT